MLSRVHRHFKRTAALSRNKLARMAAAADLFNLGLWLMNTCNNGPGKVYQATRYRDGLMIALLISCPMRLKNLTEIEIGRHLVFAGQDYRLNLAAEETKTGRFYAASVPPDLTPYIDGWLHVHRQTLHSNALAKGAVTGNHLWLDRWGQPMSSRAIRRQIERYTEH